MSTPRWTFLSAVCRGVGTAAPREDKPLSCWRLSFTSRGRTWFSWRRYLTSPTASVVTSSPTLPSTSASTSTSTRSRNALYRYLSWPLELWYCWYRSCCCCCFCFAAGVVVRLLMLQLLLLVMLVLFALRLLMLLLFGYCTDLLSLSVMSWTSTP